MKTTLLILLTLLSTCVAEFSYGKSIKSPVTETYKTVIANKQYDNDFKKHGNPNHYANAKLLKSVCGVESKFDLKAKSKKGASGICQIMPKTWKYIAGKNKTIPVKDTSVPSQSIEVASLIIDDAAITWNKLPKGKNKTSMVLASYNAGPTNIKKASKRCNSTNFAVLQKCLAKVTSKSHAKETINYVVSVQELYKKLPM
jgi:soluble lytic murein transglycosylase-like protein